MGLPFGSLFANLYVSHIENKVMDEIGPQMKPVMYTTHVYHIFVVFSSLSELENMKSALTNTSALSFLDARLLPSNIRANTSVQVEPTDAGNCFKYKSICPKRYKASVIEYFIDRAHKLTSEREEKHIAQLLASNNCRMDVIKDTTNKFISKS